MDKGDTKPNDDKNDIHKRNTEDSKQNDKNNAAWLEVNVKNVKVDKIDEVKKVVTEVKKIKPKHPGKKAMANASKSKVKTTKLKFDAAKHRKITDIFQVKHQPEKRERTDTGPDMRGLILVLILLRGLVLPS